jgi:Na+/phosphate symporter
MLKYRELFEIWEKNPVFNQAVNDSQQILKKLRVLFKDAVYSPHEDVTKRIDWDNQAFEEAVRYKILQHLAMTSGTNLIPGLILMSMVIEIEQIAEYTENITNLVLTHPQKLTSANVKHDVQEVEKDCLFIFDEIIQFYTTHDEAKTKKLINENKKLVKRCDHIIEQLIRKNREQLSSQIDKEIVLYVRHIKKITAHLLNLLTSVTVPFDNAGLLDDLVPNRCSS